jgi:hypothetical protein
MKIAFVICCKESKYAINCIDNINNYYSSDVDIFIVDSDSIDKSYQKHVQNNFLNVTIIDMKNKKYEYGAYISWYNIYGSKYDTFVFMQDSILLRSKIKEIDTLKDNTVLVFDNNLTLWSSGRFHENEWYKKNVNFPKTNEPILMTIWNSFIITQKTFEKVINSSIFQNASPPRDKTFSCAWERVWSIIFHNLDINIIPIESNQINKIFGQRQ